MSVADVDFDMTSRGEPGEDIDFGNDPREVDRVGHTAGRECSFQVRLRAIDRYTDQLRRLVARCAESQRARQSRLAYGQPEQLGEQRCNAVRRAQVPCRQPDHRAHQVGLAA